MSSGDGLDLLKPFLPGLEAALDDPDVSEVMINGPGPYLPTEPTPAPDYPPAPLGAQRPDAGRGVY